MRMIKDHIRIYFLIFGSLSEIQVDIRIFEIPIFEYIRISQMSKKGIKTDIFLGLRVGYSLLHSDEQTRPQVLLVGLAVLEKDHRDQWNRPPVVPVPGPCGNQSGR